jgi:hypothetical protein
VSTTELDEFEAELRAMLDAASTPVSSAEARSRSLLVDRPQQARTWLLRPRLVTAFALAVLLAGSIVVEILVEQAASHPMIGVTARPPAPASLDGVAVVADVSDDVAPSVEDAGTGVTFTTPNLGANGGASNPLTVTGSYVIALDTPSVEGEGPNGQVWAFRVGSVNSRLIGRAAEAFAGSTPGTVWLLRARAIEPGTVGVLTGCTVELVSVTGQTLVKPTSVGCMSIVQGVAGGLLVSPPGTNAVSIWNPATGERVSPPALAAPEGLVAGGDTIVTNSWSTSCQQSCTLTVTNSLTLRSYSLRVAVPAGMAITPGGVGADQPVDVAVSSDGRYIAVLAEVVRHHKISLNHSEPGQYVGVRTVRGQLLVFQGSTGGLALERPVSALSTSLVAWAPDDAYVFLSQSVQNLDAVPVWSASAPVRSVEPNPNDQNAPGENSVFATVPGAGYGKVCGATWLVGGPGQAPPGPALLKSCPSGAHDVTLGFKLMASDGHLYPAYGYSDSRAWSAELPAGTYRAVDAPGCRSSQEPFTVTAGSTTLGVVVRVGCDYI